MFCKSRLAFSAIACRNFHEEVHQKFISSEVLGDEPEVNDIGARHVVRNDLDSAVRGAVRHAAVGPGHRCAGVVAAAVLPGEAEPGTEAIGLAGQI